MADGLEKRDWVRRELDVEVPLRVGGGPKSPLLPIWTAAKEDLDGDIDKLQQALRKDGDPDFAAIAEYGLHGVTKGQSVRLMAALRDADSQKTPDALGKAADAVDAFRDFLESSPGVDVIEQNPLVAVPLRRTLGGALDKIVAAIDG